MTITTPDPSRLTATRALALIRSNELTVETYARSLLSRIESRDETVNAWAYLNPEFVLAQARKLDAVPFEERGPLHGLPVGVKDVIYTKDMPTEHNSPLYKDSHVPVDAAPVAILRAAGSLIFGKTTTTEFASTTNGPRTYNPHDPSRTPGGSSSGSGAAVADYQIPIALGTQTGGSTIRPGSFNGIYAVKPTWGAVSREGLKVYSLVLDTLGVFARGVEDLELILGVFGVKDDEVNGGGGTAFQGVQGARFGLVKTSVWPQAGPGTIAAVEKAAAILRSHGAIVEEIELPPEFDNMPAWHATIMAVDARTSFLSEYRRDKSKISKHLTGYVENNEGYTRVQHLAALDGIALLRPQIDGIAGRYAALLTPSVPDEAPVGIQGTGSAAFCSMWTALHTPVVNLPGFQGENGLPIGVSLVAPRFRDQHLLAVAKELGKLFEEEGGWKSSL
ncbi:Putative Amidase family protein (AFU_orthologue; AFUA_6G14410) [Aspergillus calidoustus]|uniref:Putative Amidase family protein (AFU_orthologue AFUA_6G14410) n=1 Tax=Aspergillus calidoustus TaxID=454130 RepID=A0A0U5GHD9_ASPCI|nr:Putative Amidase family protein (AFU_orthologue; AFUA_6G14410) [Aspergillus calidoustus]